MEYGEIRLGFLSYLRIIIKFIYLFYFLEFHYENGLLVIPERLVKNDKADVIFYTYVTLHIKI
jgi:hypothetical protein